MVTSCPDTASVSLHFTDTYSEEAALSRRGAAKSKHSHVKVSVKVSVKVILEDLESAET